jgi:ABC-type molybdate transport system substrate-binding protein
VRPLSKNYAVLLVVALLALVGLSACGSDDSTGAGGQRNAPSSITVLADSSLRKAFTQVGQLFETQNPGSTVTFTYGTSAELSQKAAAGDPGDVLATTDQQSMVAAQKAQLGSPQVFATKDSQQCQIVTLLQSKNSTLSNHFISLLTSPSGQSILRKAGFGAP